MTQSSVHLHLSPESVPSLPCWFAEVVLISQVLKTLGLLNLIQTKVRFARARFGEYEVTDFLAVLIGYALSGERTLQAFYARLTPLCDVLHDAVRARSASPSQYLEPFSGEPRSTDGGGVAVSVSKRFGGANPVWLSARRAARSMRRTLVRH